jgi:hypothetical protein
MTKNLMPRLVDLERQTSLLLHALEDVYVSNAPVDFEEFRVALEKIHMHVKGLRIESEQPGGN